MIEQIEDVVEERATEVIDDVVDLVDDTKRAFTRNDVRYSAIAGLILGSLLTGTITYFIGKYRNKVIETDNFKVLKSREDPNQLKLELDAEQLPDLKKRWSDELIPDSTIASMRQQPPYDYEKEEAYPEHIEHIAVADPVDEITINDKPIADWYPDQEKQNRKGQDIYIIHKDEYFENQEDYTQSTLTYYEGDEILCAEDYSPIYNHSSLVGELQFGHGSGDPNVVYIRNVTREAEYEILLYPGSYTTEVLGIEEEETKQESFHKKPSKFRPEA